MESNLLKELRDPSTVIYCWWANWTAISAALISRKYGTKFITRAHGQDLYDFRSNIQLQPFQNLIVNQARFILPDSSAGVRYLEQKYPKASSRIIHGRLGTSNHQSSSRASKEGAFELLSVSSIFPVKRVQILATGLSRLVTQSPEIDFFWTHIGDGPGLMEVMEIISKNEELIKRVKLRGHLKSHSEVLDYYLTNPIDLVINTSSSEGIPVSLMEATSFGVPIMATNVGGNPEIVRHTRGILLPSNPSPEEIADEVRSFILLGRGKQRRHREWAREGWEECYSAQKNYSKIIELMSEL
jgi:glycosyltransferase involved in cell wall biosynthesis